MTLAIVLVIAAAIVLLLALARPSDIGDLLECPPRGARAIVCVDQSTAHLASHDHGPHAPDIVGPAPPPVPDDGGIGWMPAPDLARLRPTINPAVLAALNQGNDAAIWPRTRPIRFPFD